MTVPSTASSHGCQQITNQPDELANAYVVHCECGWRSGVMIHLWDAVSMLMYHGMDVAYDRVVEVESNLGPNVVVADFRAPRHRRVRGLFARPGRRGHRGPPPAALTTTTHPALQSQR